MPNVVSGFFGRLGGLFFGWSRAERAAKAWKNALWAVIIFGAVALIAYAQSKPGSLSVFAGGALIASASALVGGFGGMIFGMPRSTATARAVARPTITGDRAPDQPATNPTQSGVAPNTNLLEISDWFTKIIVGVGLTQLGSLPGDFHRLVDFARVAVGDAPESSSVTAGLILTYAVAGFLLTYLFTRMDLEAAITAADAPTIPQLQLLTQVWELQKQGTLTQADFDQVKAKVVADLVSGQIQ